MARSPKSNKKSTAELIRDAEIKAYIKGYLAAGGSIETINEALGSAPGGKRKSPRAATPRPAEPRKTTRPGKSAPAPAKRPQKRAKEPEPEPEKEQPKRKSRQRQPVKEKSGYFTPAEEARYRKDHPTPTPQPTARTKPAAKKAKPLTAHQKETVEAFKKSWRRELKDWKAEGISANEAIRRYRTLAVNTHPGRKGIRDATFKAMWKKYHPRRTEIADQTLAIQRMTRTPRPEPVPQTFDLSNVGGIWEQWENEIPEDEEPEEITNIVLYGFVINDNKDYAIIHGGENAPDPNSGNYWFKGKLDVSDVFDLVERRGIDRMWKVGNRNRVTVGIERMTRREFMTRHPTQPMIGDTDELQKRIHADFDALTWHEKGDITGKHSHKAGEGLVKRIPSPYKAKYAAKMPGQLTLGGDE